MESYHISGFEFGVPHPKAPEVKKLIPYGVYAFDECQRYWDSKDNKSLPPWVSQAFELSGHIFLEIFLISQRYMRLHKDIRDIVDVFTYIEESEHTFVLNGKKVKSNIFIPNAQLIKTEWKGRQFDEDVEIEAYLSKADKKAGRKFSYTFYGDIRNYYDPYNYSVDFDDDSKDYNYSSQLNDTKPASWDNYKKGEKK